MTDSLYLTADTTRSYSFVNFIVQTPADPPWWQPWLVPAACWLVVLLLVAFTVWQRRSSVRETRMPGYRYDDDEGLYYDDGA